MQGDEVIKFVAHTLRDNIRGVVGRNGGDEFSFCMVSPTEEELEETMKCIHKILNDGLPLLETGEVIPTPCSIGIVIGQKEGLEYSDVIEQADRRYDRTDKIQIMIQIRLHDLSLLKFVRNSFGNVFRRTELRNGLCSGIFSAHAKR